jgi:hypothetical protein
MTYGSNEWQNIQRVIRETCKNLFLLTVENKDQQKEVFNSLLVMEARVAGIASQSEDAYDAMSSWQEALHSVQDGLQSLSASRNSIANEVTHLHEVIESLKSSLDLVTQSQQAEISTLWKEMVTFFCVKIYVFERGETHDLRVDIIIRFYP